jgi:hypothetical protein
VGEFVEEKEYFAFENEFFIEIYYQMNPLEEMH